MRLMTIGMISTFVPNQCELSAFARGVHFAMMR
jgi:hypothetical protein